MKKGWLWDKNITVLKAKHILSNPGHPDFIRLAGLLLARNNIPQEVFRDYLKPEYLFHYWRQIRRQMKKDSWNNPRIEFWQAVFEKVGQKYRGKGKKILPIKKAKPVNEFCIMIGQKIRELRKQKKITQKGLAGKLNISQQMISRIESGRENVSLLTLKKITDSLGAKVSIGY